MKSPIAFTVACILVATLSALLFIEIRSNNASKKSVQDVSETKIKRPDTVLERMSYSFGVASYRELTSHGYRLDADQFANAVRDMAAGKEPVLTEDEMQAAFVAAEQDLQKRQTAGPNEQTMLDGQNFLEENGKRAGVTTTQSGLQYEIIKAGDGPKPNAGNTVTVHYHGTLIDGTVFDSSVQRGQPTSFRLDQVIAGWTEGVALMPKGAKYKFYIPQELAYGSRGAGGKIKPYSALIFEVELLDFK